MAPDARFCGHCGAILRATPMRRQAAHLAERVVFVERPAFVFVAIAYVVCALAALAATAALAFMGASFGAALFVSFLLMVPALLKHLRRNTTTYVLTESALEIAEGLLVRRRRTIPLRSIKQVTISQTVPELVFGLGTIEIENMGDGPAATSLRRVRRPREKEEMIKQEMMRWR